MAKSAKRQLRLPGGLSKEEILNHLKYHLRNDGTFPPAYHGLFWFETNTSEIDPWIAALEVIDGRDDKKALAMPAKDRPGYFAGLVLPLQKLLKSGKPPPPDACFYLADLFDRYELKKKRFGQAAPAYKWPDAEMKMILAVDAVHKLVSSGESVAKALELTAKARGVHNTTLANAYGGRRASDRRFAKRRPS